MSLKHKVFGGAMWAGGAQVLSMACSFVLTIALARGLRPSDYGLYFIALNTIVILVNVGTIGMDRVAVRFASIRIVEKDWRGLRVLLFTCIGLVLVSAAITALAFRFFAGVLLEKYLGASALTPYLGVMAFWLFCATLQGEFTESFRGLNDIRLASLFGGVRSNGIITAVSVCGLMSALSLGGRLTLSLALWIMLFTSASVVIAASLTLAARLKRLETKGDNGDARSMTRWSARNALLESWPYWITTIIVALRLQGGAWLAGALDSANNVALYAVAQRMMLLLAGPMIISNAVLPPIVAQLHAAGQLPRLERVIRSISGLILLPSIVLTLVLILGGKLILHGFFSAYYEAAYPLLVILCLGQTFNIATGAWQTVMPMTGNQRLMLITSIVAILTQVSLGLILGRRYGVIGVSISFAASVVVTNLIGMFFVRWKLGIWTFASLDSATIRDAASLLSARLRGRKTEWQRT